MPSVNWAGFYVLPCTDSDMLKLGPFQGKVACQSIEIGRGVCGTAVAMAQTQIVTDVHAFPGHIACDALTKSEIVVPILQPHTNRVVGVIDLDSTEEAGFSELHRQELERIARLLAAACDWPSL